MSQTDDFYQKRRFIIRLGKALHKLGSTAYRLEDNLLSIAKFLDIRASFIITPTALTFILSDDEDDQQYNHLVRVTPGDIDLGSLARIDELVDELINGERTLAEATERLTEVNNKPAPYGVFLTFLAFGASSGAFAMLMHTSWNDVFWATLLGFVIFLFVIWAERSKRVTELLEPLSALTASLLASAISLIDPSINIPMVILSTIIVFIPGLSLTVGLSELAARHLMSGTARIMDSVMVLFKLYFGGVLGMALGKLMWGEVTFVPPEVMPTWTSWIAVTILSISLVILFKARIKDAPWGIISGYIAFGMSVWASTYLGVALGAFVGAFALGLYSNLFSRVMNLPSSIVRLLGLVVLVPGSKVYMGLNTLVSGQQMLNIADLGSQTFLIFMSLVAGIIFSNVALPHRKNL
ncbi:threonine/serine ThrE exporter family protein [Litorilituus lipolyticus]|uniref:Threonine/serine exporter family protein n=1 Tax=Litorilituus lipolyticus TaxID=2491017 RepID=A0A502LBB1_9GAMM|nr:threonine/serine exporter family protein [Litorilituus lipolyticus]TPH19253.1 threonine/serine exporter family protein [Litorilituus lipolyticus]